MDSEISHFSQHKVNQGFDGQQQIIQNIPSCKVPFPEDIPRGGT